MNGPDLPRAIAAFDAAGARYIVIGGFAVVAHQYVRATEDVDLLIPDDDEHDVKVIAALQLLNARRRDGEPVALADLTGREHLRVESDAGLIDLLRAGTPPLDFAAVDAGAIEAVVDGQAIRVCGLDSLVGFKRLAGRPRDRVDLEELKALNGGTLPLLSIPGLDDDA